MVLPGTLVKIFESGRMVWDCEERVNGEPFRLAVYFFCPCRPALGKVQQTPKEFAHLYHRRRVAAPNNFGNPKETA